MSMAPPSGIRKATTSVVIADRRDFDRLALEMLCQHLPDVTVVASVSTIPDAVLALARIERGVVLVGRQLLSSSGPTSVARLREAGAVRIVLVSTGEPNQGQLEAIRVGADGALQRDGDTTAQLAVLAGESGTVPRWVDERTDTPHAEG